MSPCWQSELSPDLGDRCPPPPFCHCLGCPLWHCASCTNSCNVRRGHKCDILYPEKSLQVSCENVPSLRLHDSFSQYLHQCRIASAVAQECPVDVFPTLPAAQKADLFCILMRMSKMKGKNDLTLASASGGRMPASAWWMSQRCSGVGGPSVARPGTPTLAVAGCCQHPAGGILAAILIPPCLIRPLRPAPM